MPGTLADLVQGFQGGYTGVQDARRKTRINRAIDYELERSETDARATRSDLKRMGEPGMAVESMQMPKTYGERLVGKVKSFFTGKTAPTDGLAIDPAQASAAPNQAFDYSAQETGGIQPARFNDGGAVRQLRKKYVDGGAVNPNNQSQQGRAIGYANGGHAIPSDSANYGMSRQYPPTAALGLASGGKVTVANPRVGYADGGRAEDPSLLGFLQDDPWGDLGRNTAALPARTFPSVATESSRMADMERVRRQDVIDAPTAEKRGAAIRDYASEASLGAVRTIAGAAEDIVGPVGRGLKGALGFTGEAAEETVGASADEAAAVTAAIDTDQAPTGAQPVAADPPGTRTPQAQAAAEPAGPPDEIIDFSQVRDINPEDMPNQSVTDWEDERRYWAASAIAHGNDPHEAMQAVDARQMRGFNQYGQQAYQLLRAGDAAAAARALYAAYQYFPNGADVRFGIQKGADGNPVLIGMGTDEKTGEPIKEGKPMVITAESLATQLENMSDPSAFRTWTKDWRTVEQEMREYNEITKPQAQADINLAGAQSEYYRNRGLADLIEAQTSSAGGGMKQSDYDRAFAVFKEDRELQALLGGEDEATARDLTAAMSKLYLSRPGDYNGVVKFIMDSYEMGGIDQVEQDLVESGLL